MSTLSAVAIIDKTGHWMRCWGKMGAAWAFAIGVAAFMVPGIGPWLIAGPPLAGPLAGWFIAGLETRRAVAE